MHVHSLIKVWDHRRGGWDTHLGNRVIHICVELSNMCGADVGSKVDMHICTDICTHSTQSVGPEKIPGLCMWGHTGAPMFTCNK